jgi:hypothetical protein
MTCAQRLKRVFGIDIETCPACAGAMRIIARIEDPAVIEKILGLIPLLPGVLFVNMSITNMAGLGFATVLTLIFVPTLYFLLLGVKAR